MIKDDDLINKLEGQIDHIEPEAFREYLLKQMSHNTLVKKDK